MNIFQEMKLSKHDTWIMLEEAVQAIQNRSTFVRYSLEKLNQIVANLVDGNTEIAQKIHAVSLKNSTAEHYNALYITGIE